MELKNKLSREADVIQSQPQPASKFRHTTQRKGIENK